MSLQDHIDYANTLASEEDCLQALSAKVGGKQRYVAVTNRLAEIRDILADIDNQQYKVDNLIESKIDRFDVISDGTLAEVNDV